MLPISSLLKYEARVLAIGYYNDTHQWVPVFERNRPSDVRIDSQDGVAYIVRYRRADYGPLLECSLEYFIRHGLPVNV